MRLTNHQRTTIKQTAQQLFGDSAEVILFGSRVDDSARGGDIDIMVSTSEAIDNPAYMAAKLASKLEILLGEQKIDVVIKSPSLEIHSIHETAEKYGITL